MKTIAIFGGTFDPPHNDHHRILHALVHNKIMADGKELGFREVWVAVVSEHAFEEKKPLPYEVRKPLVQEMIRKVGAPLLFHNAVKIVPQTEKYTYDFLVRLRKENPDTRFVLVVGSDVIHDTDRWYNWDGIEEEATVLPFVREDYDTPVTWQGLDPVKFAGRGFSSTKVREQLAEGNLSGLVGGLFSKNRYPGMLTEEVFNAIEREGLYGYKADPLPDRRVEIAVKQISVEELRTIPAAQPLSFRGHFSKILSITESMHEDEPTVTVKLLRDTGREKQHRKAVSDWEKRKTTAIDNGENMVVWAAQNPEPYPQSPGFLYLEEDDSYSETAALGRYLGEAHGLHFFETQGASLASAFGGLFGGLF